MKTTGTKNILLQDENLEMNETTVNTNDKYDREDNLDEE